MTTDWNAAYDNVSTVPDAMAIFTAWEEAAARFRASATLTEDIPYGPAPRERFDLVQPAQPPKGLMIFVHGGYWMRLSKSHFTHLAAGALDHGYAVAFLGYTLAPETRIAQITQQITKGVAAAAAQVDGPIILTGHSAGGHLASRMVCDDSPLGDPVRSRIAHVLSISGVHDLRPLLRTEMNLTLQLDEAEAASESPALRTPDTQASVTAWVGGNELPEFIRQTECLYAAWSSAAEIACIVDEGHNHFTVIDALADAQSRLCQQVFT